MTTRVALCGAGMIAEVHALACGSAAAAVAKVASRTADRAGNLARRTNAAVASWTDVHDDVDVVVVCTPPSHHVAHAIAALDAGATVLVEKPLARTLAEADALAARVSAGGRLVYAENLLFAPAVREFVRRLPRLGTLVHLSARSLQGAPTWGGFLEPEWGGGALFDLGIHPLALVVVAARVAGAGEPVAVSAELRGDRTDTWGRATIEFDDGSSATVESGWEGPDEGMWELQAASATGTLRLELRPAIALEHDGEPVVLPVAGHPIPLVEDFGYVSQMRHTVEVASNRLPVEVAGDRPPVEVAGDRPPMEMNVDFGRAMMELVTACYASARTGERVSLPFGGDRSLSPLEHWRGKQ